VTDPMELLATWWPVVAALIPVFSALVTNAEATRWLKKGVPVGFALAVTVLSLAEGLDGPVTPGLLVERLVIAWGLAEIAYRGADALVAELGEESFNHLPVFRPERGLK